MIDLKWTKSSTDLVSFRIRLRSGQQPAQSNGIWLLGSGGANPAVDSLFEYDELDRLIDYQGGQLNVGW